MGSAQVPNSTLPATKHAEASQSEFLGNNHKELSEWLSQTWLKAGPPVCFVEGFSGVGKTSLARGLRQHSNYASVMVDMPEGGLDQIDNLLLDLATELDIIGHTEMAEAVNAGTPLSTALEKVLRKPVLIVIDEFQNALDASGKLTNALKPLLERIANRLTFPGRLLLLSNQRIERGKWSDAYSIQSLSALEPEAAIRLLDRLLIKAKRSTEVPLERRHDVVNWLGCNPRAIGVLVTSLEQDSLEYLIGLSPDIWELRDREVSPELIHRLERELLERTLSHLQAEANQLLQQLSVHRKAVKREAFEKYLPPTVELAVIANDLMSRFLMEQHNGWFSLNPVVKEISLQRLKKSPSAFQRAHGRAADYYTRHFTAKNIVGGGQLGGYFVEARYHLVQSNRTEDLSQITGRFENHLKATYTSVSPIPKEAHELSERIAVLSALLGTPGSKGLEYYLARLLQARGTPGDLSKALMYAQRATGPSAPAPTWLLRIRLEAQLNGTEQALQVCRESLQFVPPTQNLDALYRSGAELLAQAGRVEEAISLLKDGITRIPPNLGLFSLYQSEAELLAQAGRVEEAISLLKDGITRIPPSQNLFSLYQSMGEMLTQVGRVEEAIALLQDGITRIPPALGLVALYQSAGKLLAQVGRTEEAISLLQEGINRIPPTHSLVSLYYIGATVLAQARRTEEAIALLKDGISRIPPPHNLVSLYQSGGTALAQAGRVEEAILFLQDGILRIQPAQDLVSLYQSAGELLAQVGRVEEAISLLKNGISRIPPALGLFSLYQNGANVLVQAERVQEAISLVKEGIACIPYGRYSRSRLIQVGLLLSAATRDIPLLESLLAGTGSMAIELAEIALGRTLLAQLLGDWRRAAEIAQQSTTQFPKYLLLFSQEAFSWLCAGERKAADEALRRFLLPLKRAKGQPIAWLKALIAVKNGDLAMARENLSIYLGQALDEQAGVTLDMLLKLWDTPAKRLGDTDLAFYYPTLPANLTGLPHDVTRIEYGPSVLHFNTPMFSKAERVVPDF